MKCTAVWHSELMQADKRGKGVRLPYFSRPVTHQTAMADIFIAEYRACDQYLWCHDGLLGGLRNVLRG